MKAEQTTYISSEESVVRLLHQAWVIDGVVQNAAFTLKKGETYLSVNRPAVDTYDTDVLAFIESHPSFKAQPRSHKYRRAVLNVGKVRDIDLKLERQHLNVSVEIEPRATHTKSHAGIFTRANGVAVKPDKEISGYPNSYGFSNDSILQKVRFALMALSKLETVTLPQPDA